MHSLNGALKLPSWLISQRSAALSYCAMTSPNAPAQPPPRALKREPTVFGYPAKRLPLLSNTAYSTLTICTM